MLGANKLRGSLARPAEMIHLGAQHYARIPIYNGRKGGDTAAMATRILSALALIALALWAPLAPAPLNAQDAGLSALARLDGARSSIAGDGETLAVTLALSQPVPWRVRVLDNPARLIVDFREVDFTALPEVPVADDAVLGLRAGVFRPTWSRLVVQLAAPMVVARAEMVTAGAQNTAALGATVKITLRASDEASFAAAAALPEPPEWQLPKAAVLTPPRESLAGKTGPLIVMLDPGHGGIDPGAEQGNVTEADLMLTFAREFKESLLRTGDVEVFLTRDADIFVPLEGRVSAARAAGADVFISLHADALATGAAKGATIYTLSDEASDKAAQTLAERHDRDDLLAGVDLTAQDDLIATILMDMARLETTPRIDRLARSLEGAIKDKGLKMHRFARQTAGFSVLKSPDIPSVLVELGFLSSPADLANLTDPTWRAQMVAALQSGLLDWAKSERAALPAP